jgi:glutathione S-transferase
MADLPVLYSFRRCPYAMRARMAIKVSGVKVELREVVLRDKPPELVEASAKATVPVLVLPGGQVIDESLDIMHWALRQNDPENWLASTDSGLIAQNDGPFKAALDRYKYPHRYGLEDGQSYRNSGLDFLLQLDLRLRGQAFISGDARGLCDIALFPFVRQFAATDPDWFGEQPITDVHRWLEQHLACELFSSIMQKYSRWQAGDPPTHFP